MTSKLNCLLPTYAIAFTNKTWICCESTAPAGTPQICHSPSVRPTTAKYPLQHSRPAIFGRSKRSQGQIPQCHVAPTIPSVTLPKFWYAFLVSKRGPVMKLQKEVPRQNVASSSPVSRSAQSPHEGSRYLFTRLHANVFTKRTAGSRVPTSPVHLRQERISQRVADDHRA
jgi:hypothetical protein